MAHFLEQRLGVLDQMAHCPFWFCSPSGISQNPLYQHLVEACEGYKTLHTQLVTISEVFAAYPYSPNSAEAGGLYRLNSLGVSLGGSSLCNINCIV